MTFVLVLIMLVLRLFVSGVPIAHVHPVFPAPARDFNYRPTYPAVSAEPRYNAQNCAGESPTPARPVANAIEIIVGMIQNICANVNISTKYSPATSVRRSLKRGPSRRG